MSGRKNTTVTMTTAERDRLRREANRAADLAAQNAILRRLNDTVNTELTLAHQQTQTLQNTVTDMGNQISTMHRAHSKQTAALRTQLNDQIKESNARLAQQAKETEAAIRSVRQGFKQELERQQAQHEADLRGLQGEFREELRSARLEIADSIEANNRRLEAEMEASARQIREDLNRRTAEIHARIDTVEAAVAGIANDHAALADMAREYADTAAAVLDNAAQYTHGVALLGGMDKERAALNAAQQDIALCDAHPANGPSAHSNARAAFESALRLREEAAALEREWILRHDAATLQLQAVQQQLESAVDLQVPMTDAEGEEFQTAVAVDYWTNGALTALRQRLAGIRQALESEAGSLEDLDGLRSAANQVSQEIRDAAAFALIAWRESQNRADTAADFADRLAEVGMDCVSDGYEGGDRRGPHRIVMENPVSHARIQIVQTPVVRKPEPDRESEIQTRIELDCTSDSILNQDVVDALGNEARLTLGLSEDDCHDCSGVEVVRGFEHSLSDRETESAQQWDERPAESRSVPQFTPAMPVGSGAKPRDRITLGKPNSEVVTPA